jgi:CBS domain-containing protein
MHESQLQSIPVVDESDVPIFVLTFKDVLQFLLAKFSEKDVAPGFSNTIRNWFAKPNQRMGEMSLRNFADTIEAPKEKMHTVQVGSSLRQVITIMLRTKVHRVLVVNRDSTLRSVVSQSRILEFLPSVLKENELVRKTLAELRFNYNSVKAVYTRDSVYKAFKLMLDNNISGVAVLNSQDQLVGNISATDIRTIGYKLEFWDWLGLTCENYLEKIRDNATDADTHTHRFEWLSRQDIVHITPDNTVIAAIRMMNFFHIHHLYVTDENRRPLGIISIYDVLKLLFSGI